MTDDTRTYYPNRPLAMTAANRGQRQYQDQSCTSATTQFEPDKGWVAVLFCESNIPDAWDEGFEVRLLSFTAEKTPATWADPTKPAKAPAPGGSAATAPSKGATARVWAIADELATSRADRAKVMAACEEAGINKATAGTQWSKWAKAKGF